MFKKLKNFKIVEKAPYWLIAPVVILLVAAIVFTVFAVQYKDASKGMNIGIDFAGGSIVTVTLGDELIGKSEDYNKHFDNISNIITSEEIANSLVKEAKDTYNIDLPSSIAKATITYTQTSGSGEDLALVFKYDNVSSSYDKKNELTVYRNDEIKEKLKEYYSDTNGYEDVTITIENIGATASAKLVSTALLATAITIVLILIYIIIRFEVWSGIAAVIGLVHDVAMMVLLTIIFHIQVNSAFIAALITIVSYSINNTIVVFDRVRENMNNAKGLSGSIDVNSIVNKSVLQTALRSINSTVTTLLGILLFAILGSSSVREFAMPVIFGLFAGFYSSMFLAPSLYCVMKNAAKNKKEKKIKANAPKKFAGVN